MENYNVRIQNAKKLINQADYILIGAGAGLSTAAGLEYSGESFQNNFKDFIEKYNFKDLYTATFYDFNTPEEKWAFWAKLIKLNRFNSKPLNLYKELFELVKNKEHFVITTNVDGQFEKAGFENNKIFAVQGDYAYLQCEDGCHNKLYYNGD
jgi:NAD-dependent SIR2 family protein deacetylase